MPRNAVVQEYSGLPRAEGTGTARTEREGSSAGDEARGTRSEGGTESDLRGTCSFEWKNMCHPPGFSSRATPGCFRGRGRVRGRSAHDLGLGGSPKEHTQGRECFTGPLGLSRSAPGGTAKAERSEGKPGGLGSGSGSCSWEGLLSHAQLPGGLWGPPRDSLLFNYRDLTYLNVILQETERT